MRVVVDGQEIPALPGQTVAGVLLGAGRVSWRTTRGGGRPRGVFCGIGVCFDCLVIVNGVPDVRACQRVAEDGDDIRTQHGAVLPEGGFRVPGRNEGGFRVPGRNEGHLRAQVVVVGAGPAGLAAATAAAGAGVPVTLIDSAPLAGGQYHRQDALRGTDRFALPAGVTHLASTVVWALEPVHSGFRVHQRSGPADSPHRSGAPIDTAAIVLATGAYDRALPFPGWDLPGVYTAGAAQALAKGQRVAAGKRVVLAGTGPFLLAVAAAIIRAGGRVLAIHEANDPLTGWLATPRGMLAGYAKAGELARYAGLLARHRVPFHRRSTVFAAHGTDRVDAVTTARLDGDWRVLPGTERQVQADAVCVGFGFTPQLELAVAANCVVREGFVVVDAGQATSVPGVFAAGELTGIGGAALAAAEGTVAGVSAAKFLGAQVAAPVRALRRVRAGHRFAAALAEVYPVRPGWRDWLRDDTLVCRCEEVGYGELRRVVEDRGAAGARPLRLVSRAGLGHCQGRVCGRNVAELTGIAGDSFARRPIAAPVRLGELMEEQ